MIGASTAVIFGGYLPREHDPAVVALWLLHIAGMFAVLAAVVVVLTHALRRARSAGGNHGGDGDLVSQVLAAGILLNLAAYLVSTLPVDLFGGREVISVLPYGAALVARVFISRLKPVRVLPTLSAVLVVLSVALATRPMQLVGAPENPQEVADWLVARNLAYGVGSYWTANNITLLSSGRVQVAPLTTGTPVVAYRRESRADWYDPARHDARFVVVDVRDVRDHVLDTAISRFGPPLERHDFTAAVVLLYDHNLLVGLPAECGAKIAASMADC
jgi:hypothetical protein